MSKTTTKQTGIANDAAYNTIIDKIADLTVKRDKAQARLDKAVLDAHDQYGADVTAYDNQIACNMALAEQYAQIHRDSLLPGDKKSGETDKARWGFRLGNPTLKTLSRKWTWPVITARIIETGRSELLKITDPQPDKDRIKASLNDEELASIGLRVTQSESYWVEPKTDSAERINA